MIDDIAVKVVSYLMRWELARFYPGFGLVCASCFFAIIFACPVEARVDNSSLNGKLIMGYQGWFGCPADGGAVDWTHWKAAGSATVDMLPDVSEFSPDEKCNSGWADTAGNKIYLFSSLNAKTVDRHFQWMENYGIDGVAVQKFASQLFNQDSSSRSDVVLQNIRCAAEKRGRVFFLMYDVSGATREQLDAVAEDWTRLIRSGLLRSSAYLAHRGRVVLGLWGLGFRTAKFGPADASAFVKRVRSVTSLFGGVTILGGVPTYWRSGTRDASPDPDWQPFWRELDVLSPWTVGRFGDDKGADLYRSSVLEPDTVAALEMQADLMPVLFPGFSWWNLAVARGQTARTSINQIPRRCGRFFWRQARNALAVGSRMLYVAMFDEVDEGTAMFKVLAKSSEVPNRPAFVALGADGCELPSDWYLQLAGRVGAALSSGKALPEFRPYSPGSQPAR